MSYSELLRDPRWQKKRLQILKRDKWTCCYCRSKEKTLNVHHLQYINGKKPWEYKNDVLITACEDCHSRLSDKDEISVKLLRLNTVLKDGHFNTQQISWITIILECIEDMRSCKKIIFFGSFVGTCRDYLLKNKSCKDYLLKNRLINE